MELPLCSVTMECLFRELCHGLLTGDVLDRPRLDRPRTARTISLGATAD